MFSSPKESCSLLNNVEENVDLQIRVELACKPGVDYVYKAKLVRSEEENGYDNYFMKVLEVIKEGNNVHLIGNGTLDKEQEDLL
ncbi:venom factor-like [Sceloporus undulatus]|uniref:venom factor-like n=1 Tax=Sceloporus undulatus TaxID=8520 RepID=UPI001C4BCD90|nr:venom factor-like [Sceloporus undulatus]